MAFRAPQVSMIPTPRARALWRRPQSASTPSTVSLHAVLQIGLNWVSALLFFAELMIFIIQVRAGPLHYFYVSHRALFTALSACLSRRRAGGQRYLVLERLRGTRIARLFLSHFKLAVWHGGRVRPEVFFVWLLCPGPLRSIAVCLFKACASSMSVTCAMWGCIARQARVPKLSAMKVMRTKAYPRIDVMIPCCKVRSIAVRSRVRADGTAAAYDPHSGHLDTQRWACSLVPTSLYHRAVSVATGACRNRPRWW